MRGWVFGTVAALTLALPATAQDAQTLADIRQELSVLSFEVQKLRTELSTTGGSQVNISGDVLRRVDAIEQELARLTSKSEGLENRINRVVSDGTNRIGDLEFRLCELETGCDIGALGTTSTLGGGSANAGVTTPAAPATPAQPSNPVTDGVELAVSEKADFERAQGALASGDFRSAADQFAAFTQSYPGGPLSSEAHYLRGEALRQAGDWNGAARAYLDSFSGSPGAPRAPEALYQLGLALNQLGQTSEACLMLEEVGNRFPASDQVVLAQNSRAEIGCS